MPNYQNHLHLKIYNSSAVIDFIYKPSGNRLPLSFYQYVKVHLKVLAPFVRYHLKNPYKNDKVLIVQQ